MNLVVVLLGLTLIMIIASKDAHRMPGFEAVYGAVGVVFFFLATKVLSCINQKEGLVDD